MANEKEQDPTSYWRDRYLSLLSEKNELQAQHTAKEELWRRGLALTSLFAEGQASAVDTQLHALRSAINNDNQALLSDTLQQLRTSIDESSHEAAKRQEILLGQIHDAADRLSHCPLPKPLIKRIKKIRQHAAHELSTHQGQHQQLQSWIQILGEFSQLEHSKPYLSWIQQWFKPNPTITVANDEAQEEEQAHITQEVSAAVQNLLQQIVTPDPLAATQKMLCERLQEDLSWEELVPLLEDASNFLLECLQSNQVSIERFLHNLDQRLQTIRMLVSGASNNQEERSKAREDLDSMVREQLTDIGTVLIGTTDVKQLGDSVRDHLGLILQALEHYQEGEQNREQTLSEQLLELQQRLSQAEQDLQESRQVLEMQKQKATTDSLTGLPNREAYELRLAEEYARFSRYKTTLSIAIVDIDFFKKINDTYGHLAGDKVLQLIAKTLQQNIRDVDFIGRFGGEEFVILMPETNLEQAYIAAEKLRQVIEISPFNFRKERVFITLSLGVAEFKQGEAPSSVFERADKALYQSKNRGRNATYKG